MFQSSIVSISESVFLDMRLVSLSKYLVNIRSPGVLISAVLQAKSIQLNTMVEKSFFILFLLLGNIISVLRSNKVIALEL